MAVTADGGKLPPMVIFKLKKVPKEKFSKGLLIRTNESGWMTSEMMIDWIENVWNNRKGSFFTKKEESVLVMDSAPAHIAEDVKAVAQKFTEIAVIQKPLPILVFIFQFVFR